MDQPIVAGWPEGLSPRDLAVFRAVFEAGAQRPVAEALGVSPSAVSRSVRRLESTLGVALFTRVGRRVAPTREAEEAYRHAVVALEAGTALAGAARDMRAGRTGVLRLAGSVVLGSYWLPPRLGRFLERFPAVKLEIGQGPAFALYEELRRGRYDMVVAPGEDLPAELRRLVLGGTQVLLVAPPGMRPPAHPDAAWLARQPYVCAPTGTRGRAMFDALLADLSVSRRTVVAESAHPEGVKALVRAGRGLAMAFRESVASELARGDLVAVIEPPGWRVPVQAFSHATRRPVPLLIELLRELAEVPQQVG